MLNLGPYRKTIVAVVGALVGIASVHFGDANEGVQAAVALLTALGVYGVSNA